MKLIKTKKSKVIFNLVLKLFGIMSLFFVLGFSDFNSQSKKVINYQLNLQKRQIDSKKTDNSTYSQVTKIGTILGIIVFLFIGASWGYYLIKKQKKDVLKKEKNQKINQTKNQLKENNFSDQNSVLKEKKSE